MDDRARTETERTRKSYPSDVTNDEWWFVAPYLTLMREDAPQREYDLRHVFDALRYLIKTGGQWRFLPHDFPPWQAVYQQARRWLAAGVFEAIAHDLREILRVAVDRQANPSAAILDARTLQSTPESGRRAGYDGPATMGRLRWAGYDGHKRRKGSKVHAAVDTLGHLLALHVTPASEQERAQVATLAERVQQATHNSVTLTYVDQGYTGDDAAEAAKSHEIELCVIKHTEAKKGFVLLPRRWVVERSFGWLARFRRLARDYERRADTLAGWHWLAFVGLMLRHVVELMAA